MPKDQQKVDGERWRRKREDERRLKAIRRRRATKNGRQVAA